MNTRTLPNRLLNILISLIAVAVLGTLGCSSSSQNPVGTGFDTPQELTSSDPGSPSLDADGRSAQILWYEYDEGSTEPNNTKDEAYQVFHAQLFNGDVDAETDQNDYFSINAFLVPTTIYVKLGWTTDAWLNLYVYDSDLNPVAYNNMETGGPKELFCYELDPGWYYVRVKAFEGASDYRIKFGVGRQLYETANDSMDTTTWIIPDGGTGDEPYRSVVSETLDQNDYLQVQVEEDEAVSATLDWVGLWGTDLNLYLYDSAHNPVVFSNGSACPEAFSSGILDAGTYYIRVRAASGEAIYELDVTVREPIVIDPGKFNQYKVPKWEPPEPPVDIFDFPFNPDEMRPLPEIPPQLIEHGPHGPWNGDEGAELPDLPQMPSFGY